MWRAIGIVAGLLFATMALAEDEASIFDFGGDSFRAGYTVTHDAEGTDDLFMAGQRVTGTSDITGTAHLAGRKVTMRGAMGGDLYAAGEEVRIEGAVTGDATLAGREVSVGDVGGDLRIAGSEVAVTGAVGGYAMIAGEEVEIDAVIAGDVSLGAEEIAFSDAARAEGQVFVYEETPGEMEIPASFAPEDRIERREIEDWEADTGVRTWSVRRAVGKFLLGVIVVAGLAALVAGLMPERLAAMRRRILDAPFRALWLGFLTQSAVIGSAVIFAMTLIGIILVPAAIFVAFVGGFAGYVIGAYAFGVGLLLAFGRPEPDSLQDRAIAAGVGALAAGVIGLIPFIGWLFVLALVLAGLGAITIRLFRPEFFSDRP